MSDSMGLQSKYLLIVVVGVAAASIGGFVVWSSLSAQQIHTPISGMGEGLVQPASKNPFSLEVKLSSDSPKQGEDVEVRALVKSNVSPHSRVVVQFFVDGNKAKEVSGVIIPLGTESVVHNWLASRGTHMLQVVLSSPAGETYTSWEKNLNVQ